MRTPFGLKHDVLPVARLHSNADRNRLQTTFRMTIRCMGKTNPLTERWGLWKGSHSTRRERCGVNAYAVNGDYRSGWKPLKQSGAFWKENLPSLEATTGRVVLAKKRLPDMQNQQALGRQGCLR